MKGDNLITLTSLKERGWTDSIIKKMEVTPDKLAKNPFSKKSPQVKLFSLEKVEELEKTDLFKTLLEAAKKRSSKGKEVAKMRFELAKKEVEALEIKVKFVGDESALTKKACKHYNDLWSSRGDYDKVATPSDSKDFLRRITVNYLRHELSDYEYFLDDLYGSIGAEYLRTLMRNKILDRISEIYPFLKAEADRQKYPLFDLF